MPAESSRSPPTSPTASARCSPTRRPGGALPAQVAEWLTIQKRRSAAAEARPAPGRDVSARRPLLHGRLPVRGAARAPDPRHAPHPPARAGAAPPDRVRRHRLFDRHLGARRPRPRLQPRRAEPRRALRRGHARRRPRSVDGGELPAQAHVPEHGADLGADREAPSRTARSRAGRSRSRPTSSTTCSAATSPTTS